MHGGIKESDYLHVNLITLSQVLYHDQSDHHANSMSFIVILKSA